MSILFPSGIFICGRNKLGKAISVELSDTSSVKLLNGMTMASLPWQSHFSHVSIVWVQSELFLKMHLDLSAKCPSLLPDSNQN
jgi:hypothetical protein